MSHPRPFDTRPWVLGVSVFLSALVCCSQAVGQELDATQLPQPTWREVIRLPCGIPFECVDATRFRNAEVRWKLSFDPRRPALYDIVHWRVAYYGRAGHDGPREFVAQYVRPAGGMPHYRVLKKVRVRDWKRAWLAHKWDWRELERPGNEYREAMLELIRVFMAADALRTGSEAEKLQF